MRSVVVVKWSTPETIHADYNYVLECAGLSSTVAGHKEIILKLNLSWTRFFPACSSPPWQLDATAQYLLSTGLSASQIIPVENKTVVTNPRKGAQNNHWNSVFQKHNLKFRPLPEERWVQWQPKASLLALHRIFPEGIEIPEMFVGRPIVHLPTMKTHGHSTTTGAIKNSFGGLLKEVRHYCHKHMHEVLVDLMLLQKEIHPGVFAIMDGTTAGNGAGPRTMEPRDVGLILASQDSVAVDALAARIMGFYPLSIPYLRICHEMGLGVADPEKIEVVGDAVKDLNLGFTARRSLVIWGDQMLRRGPLRFLEKPLLHSKAVGWAPLASNVYHDYLWYPLVGKRHVNRFLAGRWGTLFKSYGETTV